MQRVLFLTSANNGLTQRAAAALRTRGHHVRTAVVRDSGGMIRATTHLDFDLIICPYLKTRIPEQIWKRWRTVVIHPGAVGDRGPSSLDWAITDALPAWGVTALSAVDDLDGGPIWAWRTFEMPSTPVRKSDLYNGPVADAAVECVLEVVDKAADPAFTPTPADRAPVRVESARSRPAMTQRHRSVDWDASSADIVRAVHAADGSPGLLTNIGDAPVYVFDAKPAHGQELSVAPGTAVGRRHGAVRIATGDGSVWIGHARAKRDGVRTLKLPATHVFTKAEHGVDVEKLPIERAEQPNSILYHRGGPDSEIGVLAFDLYNGAMSTVHCHRLLRALRHALAQPTKMLVLLGGWTYFSNGIHLNVIEAAPDPAAEAWRNIKAINAISRELIMSRDQIVVAGFTGNAGAGGVMLPLGADVVVARKGIVLNPHYATMGLYGSELHTYSLARRVGSHTANRLTTECAPVDAVTARAMGLVDEIGPRRPRAFGDWVMTLAGEIATTSRWRSMLAAKRNRLDHDEAVRPIEAYEAHELEQMRMDMFENRNRFAEKRYAFVHKLPA